jgi:hypothetical protein
VNQPSMNKQEAIDEFYARVENDMKVIAKKRNMKPNEVFVITVEILK